jgi:hypothetical protein
MPRKPDGRLLEQKDPHFRRIARRTRYGARIEPREDRPDANHDFIRKASSMLLERTVMLGLPPDWTVRFQGERGTCVPEAAAACAEYELFRNRLPVVELSAQFIHYKIKEMQLRHNVYSDRDWLYEAASVLTRDGVSTNADRPYDPSLPADLIGPRPSPDATLKAKELRFNATVLDFVRADGNAREDWSGNGPPEKKRSPVDWIVGQLHEGTSVAMTIPVQNMPPGSDGPDNWTTRVARMVGVVADPRVPWCPAPKHFPPAEGHAVCILGCVPDGNSRPRWFIFRNSWGLDWASEVPSAQPFAIKELPGRGYGAISARYVDKFCSELMTLQLLDPEKARGAIAP